MTTENRTLITLEKIKAFAMGFIGAGIFSMGSTYFSAQDSYNIPRILYPVYEIFGNIGLAIGMLILGIILMYYGYKKFINSNGKPSLFIVFQVIGVFIFYGLIYASNIKPSTEELNKNFQETQKNAQLEIENTERPKLKSAAINTYFENLEELHKKYQKSQDEHNKTLFDECEKEYPNLINTEYNKVYAEIGNSEGYKEFIMYNAKILGKINALRVQNANN